MFIVAGPCAAESRSQVLATAKALAAAGVRVFRAGAWKPRSLPGAFEGVGEQALAWLQEAGQTYGLETATEVANAEQVRLALRYGVRWLWLGARTTTNPFLVQEIADALKKEAGESKGVTVLVKNPLSPDIRLWEGAVLRIAEAVGEQHVMAVHRGFQTGQPSVYRNAPCWSIAFSLRRRMPFLPLLLDASHMAGQRSLIPDLCQKALNLGYDGLMLESHPDPDNALSDAPQQLAPADLQSLLRHLTLRQPATRNADSSGNDPSLLLSELRNRIDETDDALWALILQRMQISAEIGAYKKEQGLPVLQSERFAAMLERRLSWARQVGLSDDCVRRILDALHEESCRRQL